MATKAQVEAGRKRRNKQTETQSAYSVYGTANNTFNTQKQETPRKVFVPSPQMAGSANRTFTPTKTVTPSKRVEQAPPLQQNKGTTPATPTQTGINPFKAIVDQKRNDITGNSIKTDALNFKRSGATSANQYLNTIKRIKGEGYANLVAKEMLNNRDLSDVEYENMFGAYERSRQAGFKPDTRTTGQKIKDFANALYADTATASIQQKGLGGIVGKPVQKIVEHFLPDDVRYALQDSREQQVRDLSERATTQHRKDDRQALKNVTKDVDEAMYSKNNTAPEGNVYKANVYNSDIVDRFISKGARDKDSIIEQNRAKNRHKNSEVATDMAYRNSITDDMERVKHITAEQEQRYNFVLGKYGSDVAKKYWDNVLSLEIDKTIANKQMQETADFANRHKVMGGISNAVSSLAQGTGYISDVGDSFKQAFTDTDIPTNPNKSAYAPTRNVIATEQGITRDMNGVQKFFADAVLSAGQNMVNLPLGSMGLFNLGLGAAAQSTYEKEQQGFSREQALRYGTIAGGVEILTEKLPFDIQRQAFMGGKNGMKTVLENLFKGAVSEGLEEGAGNIIQNVADIWVFGEKSEYEQYRQSLITKYTKDGMTRNEAEEKATSEALKKFFVSDTFMNALAGAVSGGMITGTGAATSAAAAAVDTAVDDVKTGKAIKAEGGAQEVFTSGKLAQQGSYAYEQAKKGEERYHAKGRVSDYTVGRQARLNVEQALSEGDTVKAISEALNVPIDEVDTDDFRGLFETDNGRRKISLSSLMDNSRLETTLHEGDHAMFDILKSSGADNLIKQHNDFIYDMAKRENPQAVKAYEDRIRADYKKRGQNVADEVIKEEVGAEIASHYKLTAEMINEAVKNNKGAVRKMVVGYERAKAKIRDMLSKGAYTEQRYGMQMTYSNLQKGQEMYLNALAQASRQNSTESTENSEKYSFAGEKAKTSNVERLTNAKQLEQSGRTAEEIRKQTGWAKGLDGKWRFEIDDSQAEFNRQGFTENPDLLRYRELEQKFIYGTITDAEQRELLQLNDALKGVRKPSKLSDFLKHDALFKAYPELKDINVRFLSNIDENGSYGSNTKTITLNTKRTTEQMKATLLHEVQHAIQDIEGFARGSSPENFAIKRSEQLFDKMVQAKEKLNQYANNDEKELIYWYGEFADRQKEFNAETFAKAYDRTEREIKNEDIKDLFWDYAEAVENYYRDKLGHDGNFDLYQYRNSAGEIEARDTANRANMTAEERQANFPESMRQRDNVVFTDGTGNGMQYSGWGNGYDGYSMSNNARAAYDDGEMPLSKWTKAEIVKRVAQINPNIDVSKLRADTLKKNFLSNSSWHHTSMYYNKTNFYDVNKDYVEKLQQRDIDSMTDEKLQSKTETNKYKGNITYLTWSGTRKHPKAKSNTLKNVNIEEKGSFYIVTDNEGREILRKKKGSNGTEVTNLTERQEWIDRVKQNSSKAAGELYEKLLNDGYEFSSSFHMYKAGRKPTRADYEDGLDMFFKVGEQRLEMKGPSRYILQTWNGTEWVDEDTTSRRQAANENDTFVDRDGKEGYTENNQNGVMWTLQDNILSDNEIAEFYTKLSETKSQNYKNYHLSNDGDVIYEIGYNKLVYTDGDYNYPEISKVVTFNTNNRDIVEYAIGEIYNGEREGYSYEETANFVKAVLGKEIITTTTLETFTADTGISSEQSTNRSNRENGRKANSNSGTNGNGQVKYQFVNENDSFNAHKLAVNIRKGTDIGEDMTFNELKGKLQSLYDNFYTANQQARETQNFDGIQKAYDDIVDFSGELARKYIIDRIEDENIKEIRRMVRGTVINVAQYANDLTPDKWKDYQDSVRGYYTPSKSNGVPMDSLYMELSSQFPSYFPDDVYNIADQLQILKDVVTTKGDVYYPRTENEIQEITNDIAGELYRVIVDTIRTQQPKTPPKAEQNTPKAENKPQTPQQEPTYPDTPPREDFINAPYSQGEQNSMLGNRYSVQNMSNEQISQMMQDRNVNSINDMFPDMPTRKEHKNGKSAFVKNEAEKWFNKAYTTLVDDMNPINQFTHEAERGMGKKLFGAENPYVLAMNAKDVGGRIGYVLTENVVDYDNNVVGKGLLSILKDHKIKGKALAEFEDYLRHRHAVEWLDPNKHGSYKQVYEDEELNNIPLAKRAIAELEHKYPEFKSAAQDVYKFQRQVMQTWLVDTGVMTQKMANDLWEMYPDYVPFFRAKDNGYSNKKGKNEQTPINTATGDSTPIFSILENIATNVSSFISMGTENRVKQSLVTLYDNMPQELSDYMVEVVPEVDEETGKINYVERTEGQETAPDNTNINIAEDENRGINTALDRVGKITDNVFSVIYDGQRRYFRSEGAFLKAVDTLRPERVEGLLALIQAFSRTRAALMTTFSPRFSLLTNPVRDVQTALVNTSDTTKIKYLGGIATSYIDIAKNSDEYKAYLAMGGKYSNMQTQYRDNVQEALKKLDTKDKNVVQKFFNLLPSGFEKYQGLGDMIEAAPRLSEFNRALKDGYDYHEALFRAKDVTTNFSRHGIVGKQLNVFSNFFNASIQGVDKYFRQAKNNPASFAVGMCSLGLIALAQWAWNWKFGDDEDEENLSNYTKNNNWYFAMGNGKYIKIPKGRESVALVTAIQGVTDTLIKKQGDRFKNFFADYLLNQFLPDGNFVGLTTGYQLWANKDYLGRDIVPDGLSKLPEPEQYDDTTSYLARGISYMLDKIPVVHLQVSPKKIDAFLSGETGVFQQLNKQYFSPAGQKDILGMLTLGAWGQFNADSLFSTDQVNYFYDGKDKAEKRSNGKNASADDIYTYNKYYQASGVLGLLNSLYKGEKDEDKQRQLRRYYVVYAKEQKDNPIGYSNNVKAELERLYTETSDNGLLKLPSISPKTGTIRAKIDGEWKSYTFNTGLDVVAYQQGMNYAVDKGIREVMQSYKYADMSDAEKTDRLLKAISESKKQFQTDFIRAEGNVENKTIDQNTPIVVNKPTSQDIAQDKATSVMDSVASRITSQNYDGVDVSGYSADKMLLSKSDMDNTITLPNKEKVIVPSDVIDKHYSKLNEQFVDTVNKVFNGEMSLDEALDYTDSKGKTKHRTAKNPDGSTTTFTGNVVNDDGSYNYDDLQQGKIIYKIKQKIINDFAEDWYNGNLDSTNNKEKSETKNVAFVPSSNTSQGETQRRVFIPSGGRDISKSRSGGAVRTTAQTASKPRFVATNPFEDSANNPFTSASANPFRGRNVFKPSEDMFQINLKKMKNAFNA